KMAGVRALERGFPQHKFEVVRLDVDDKSRRVSATVEATIGDKISKGTADANIDRDQYRSMALAIISAGAEAI
ncbi:hypothetical protein ABTM97_19375, partial [Acinetobacter baumannii]